VTHEESSTEEENRALILRTAIMLICLSESNYFGITQDEDGLSEDQMMIGKLLHHFQAGIRYNLHTIYQVIRPNYVHIDHLFLGGKRD